MSGAILGLIVVIAAIWAVDALQAVGVEDASNETEQFAESEKRPGESLREWGCQLVDPADDDLIRCDARYSNGRGYVLHFRRTNGGDDLELIRVRPRVKGSRQQ